MTIKNLDWKTTFTKEMGDLEKNNMWDLSAIPEENK